MPTTAQIETDARTIVNCLMSAPDALPFISACAVVGNAWEENNCLPVTTGPKDHGSDGMMQWRLGRLSELQRRANWDTLPVQCQFFKDECKRDYPHLWAQLLNPGALRVPDLLATLTLNITTQYEKPNPAFAHNELRIGYARHVQALMQGKTPIPVPPPTTRPPLTDPTTTTPPPALPPLGGFLPILLQLFEAFGKGFATVLVDRLLGGKLTLPFPLPAIPTVQPPVPTVQPVSNIGGLLTALNANPELLTPLTTALETALTNALVNQGKTQ